MANILGIKTGELNKKQTEKKIKDYFNFSACQQIVTPNPEIILKAQKDEELFYILNEANLSLADGFGLKIITLLSHQKLFRQTGADLLPHLLNEANSNNRKIIILNRSDGLSSKEEIENYLKKKYVKIDFLILNIEVKEKPSDKECATINIFAPDLIISLFGAPYQEKYIHNLKKNNLNFKIGVGLGGAFDFLTGKVKRAPSLMRRAGLEWLWRLIQQPKRITRIYQATFVFFFKSLKWLYILPLLYRQNVAVLVYRNTSAGKEIIIVERQDEKNHWQLIQGGTEGLSIEMAGLKEMSEELNIKDYQVKGVYKNLYKYLFEKNNGKYRDSKLRHFGYKGQKQSLIIVKFTGREADIKINYWDHQNWKFINERDFITALHHCRQEAGKIYLKKLNKL